MQKKWIVMLLLSALAVAVALSGCSQNRNSNSPVEQKNTNGNAEDAGDDQSIVNAPGVFPIVNEPVTLKIMVKILGGVDSYSDNEFTRQFEQLTNIKIEWDEVPAANAQEKLNLVLQSGDYPDVLLNFGLTPSQQVIYAEQGVFLRLNDLIDQYGDNLKTMFKEYPDIKSFTTSTNGEIYALPRVTDCYHCTAVAKMWIYKPWLDKLGLSVPKTTDEYYEVLKAFKDQDPNGNGLQDEIPLSGSENDLYGQKVYSFLMNSFILSDNYNIIDQKNMLLQDGKVDVAFNKPEWKKGLEYLSKLYGEGLIHNESFTQDINQFRQVARNETVILGSFSSLIPSLSASPEEGTPQFYQNYVIVPPLKGPDGYQSTPAKPEYNHGGFIITSAAKHPEVAIRFADWFYKFENWATQSFGPEGGNWRMAKDGEIAINGKQAVWKKEEKMVGNQGKHTWGNTFNFNMKHSTQVAVPGGLEEWMYQATLQYDPYKVSVMPSLFYSGELSAELTELTNTIMDYVDEMTARFIVGDAKLEEEWDTYLQTLESMNLKRFIQIQQETYNQSAK